MNEQGWEGLGGPVRVDGHGYGGIDPALDDCCRREVESNRRQKELQAALSRHDVTILAERRRRHLVTTKFGDGCRCCYDPDSDGGEYRALMEARDKLQRDDEEKKEEAAQSNASEDVRTLREREAENANAHEHNHDEDDDKDSDDEFDYLLDEDLPVDFGLQEAEERRRAELEFNMLRLEVAKFHGYGAHRQLHPKRVLRAAGLAETGLPNPPARVVLHLVDPDSDLSGQLDIYLESLAVSCMGTKFLRSGGRPTLLLDSRLASKVLPRIRPDVDMPCLVAIRNGTVVTTSSQLKEFVRADGDGLVTHAVRSWLEAAGVLEESPPAYDDICRIRPEEDALLDTMRTNPAMQQQFQQQQEEERRRKMEAESEDFYDCGVKGCCKQFWHEHVGVKNDSQNGVLVSESTVAGVKESDNVTNATAIDISTNGVDIEE